MSDNKHSRMLKAFFEDITNDIVKIPLDENEPAIYMHYFHDGVKYNMTIGNNGYKFDQSYNLCYQEDGLRGIYSFWFNPDNVGYLAYRKFVLTFQSLQKLRFWVDAQEPYYPLGW